MTVRGDALVCPKIGQGGIGATAAGLDVAFVDLEIWHLFKSPADTTARAPCCGGQMVPGAAIASRSLSALLNRLW
jgi:hypothetical protein